MGRMMMRVAAICVAAAVLAGCQTVRVREQDAMEGAPEWAIRNAMPEMSGDMAYFVGVSGEQVLSESEAIDQAYENAVRRAADAIGMTVASWNGEIHRTNSGARADWPYITGKHLGAFGNSIIPTIERSEYDREDRAGTITDDRNLILRDQIVGMARIVDTWTIRENFRMHVSVNPMKYGELWKAKVLVGIPMRELEDRARQEYEIRMREVELQFEPAPKPTFSFMNNSEGYFGSGNCASKGTHFISYLPGCRPEIFER